MSSKSDYVKLKDIFVVEKYDETKVYNVNGIPLTLSTILVNWFSYVKALQTTDLLLQQFKRRKNFTSIASTQQSKNEAIKNIDMYDKVINVIIQTDRKELEDYLAIQEKIQNPPNPEQTKTIIGFLRKKLSRK